MSLTQIWRMQREFGVNLLNSGKILSWVPEGTWNFLNSRKRFGVGNQIFFNQFFSVKIIFRQFLDKFFSKTKDIRVNILNFKELWPTPMATLSFSDRGGFLTPIPVEAPQLIADCLRAMRAKMPKWLKFQTIPHWKTPANIKTGEKTGEK